MKQRIKEYSPDAVYNYSEYDAASKRAFDYSGISFASGGSKKHSSQVILADMQDIKLN